MRRKHVVGQGLPVRETQNVQIRPAKHPQFGFQLGGGLTVGNHRQHQAAITGGGSGDQQGRTGPVQLAPVERMARVRRQGGTQETGRSSVFGRCENGHCGAADLGVKKPAAILPQGRKRRINSGRLDHRSLSAKLTLFRMWQRAGCPFYIKESAVLFSPTGI